MSKSRITGSFFYERGSWPPRCYRIRDTCSGAVCDAINSSNIAQMPHVSRHINIIRIKRTNARFQCLLPSRLQPVYSHTLVIFACHNRLLIFTQLVNVSTQCPYCSPTGPDRNLFNITPCFTLQAQSLNQDHVKCWAAGPRGLNRFAQ